MVQSNQKEIFKLILDTFVKTYETLQAERGEKRPQSLADISPEKLQVIKEAVYNAGSKGILGEIKKNISFENYRPFSDAIASEIAGKLDIKVQCVIKAGGKKLEDQIHFIETKRPEYKPLYPALLGEAKFNKDNDKYNYVCLMEYLANYISFHEMIFKSKNQDKLRINKAINLIFDVLSEIYWKEYNKYSSPNLPLLYLEDRIKSRLYIGRKRFNTEVKFPSVHKGVFENFDDLLEKEIQIEDTVLHSFNHCLPSIKDVIKEVTPSFTTLVHGDAHPANIMIDLFNIDSPVRFLDPNVYIKNSDYLYDMGKMIHWLDKFGFIALETATSKKIVNVTYESVNDKIKIQYEFDSSFPNINRICELKDYSLECVYKHIEAIADYFEDTHWKKRLNIAIASAYIGGLAYVDKPNQFLICLVEALRYLNKFIV